MCQGLWWEVTREMNFHDKKIQAARKGIGQLLWGSACSLSWYLKQKCNGITWSYFTVSWWPVMLGTVLFGYWTIFFLSFGLSREFWKMLKIWSISSLALLLPRYVVQGDSVTPGALVLHPLWGSPQLSLSCSEQFRSSLHLLLQRKSLVFTHVQACLCLC